MVKTRAQTKQEQQEQAPPTPTLTPPPTPTLTPPLMRSIGRPIGRYTKLLFPQSHRLLPCGSQWFRNHHRRHGSIGRYKRPYTTIRQIRAKAFAQRTREEMLVAMTLLSLHDIHDPQNKPFYS